MFKTLDATSTIQITVYVFRGQKSSIHRVNLFFYDRDLTFESFITLFLGYSLKL